jgi:hypothetical protein
MSWCRHSGSTCAWDPSTLALDPLADVVDAAGESTSAGPLRSTCGMSVASGGDVEPISAMEDPPGAAADTNCPDNCADTDPAPGACAMKYGAHGWKSGLFSFGCCALVSKFAPACDSMTSSQGKVLVRLGESACLSCNRASPKIEEELWRISGNKESLVRSFAPALGWR